jgi:ferric-dicitrate binding protein FerR (iron transport regulator)
LPLGNPQLGHLKISGSFPTGNLDLALNTVAAGLPVGIVRGAGQVVPTPLDEQPRRSMPSK